MTEERSLKHEMDLELRYKEIQQKFEELSDFSEEELTRSRNLFHLDNSQVVPKSFEVWTSLVGLPVPNHLTQKFQTIANRITEQLPAHARFYEVLPQNYHWEVFIIKRPDENVDSESLQKVPKLLREVLCNQPPLTLSYRGFLITTDGTIIVKGYGNFDELRVQFRQAMPFASLQQSRLGHISLGRILDPVGCQAFTELKRLVQNSQNDFYGELEVITVKYVHESQWYMEKREVVATLAFGTSAI
jgi:hypothetical protein